MTYRAKVGDKVRHVGSSLFNNYGVGVVVHVTLSGDGNTFAVEWPSGQLGTYGTPSNFIQKYEPEPEWYEQSFVITLTGQKNTPRGWDFWRPWRPADIREAMQYKFDGWIEDEHVDIEVLPYEP
jgi:hypothetical protein